MISEEILVGDDFYAELESNAYLHEIYASILHNYSLSLFNVNKKTGIPRSFNIAHALRFADLLSKSNHSTKSELHKIWAQEIVALLDKLHPDDPIIKHFLGSVLSSAGNILGERHAGEYQSLSPYDAFFHDFNKELLRVPVVGENAHFFRTQKQAFDRFSSDYFSYSGPTSMGKSFIMRMFLKKQVQENANMNFAILVPTKALINEVKSEISSDLDGLLADKNYKIVTSAGSLFLRSRHNFIFVLTPERLLYLLISYPSIELNYLFVDEAHKISSKDARSTFYYKVVGMLARRTRKPHIIFASPNIPNPEVYLKLIPDSNPVGNRLAAKYAPVSQMKYFIDMPSRKVMMFNKYNHELSVLVPKINEQATFCQIVKHISRGSQTIVYCSSKAKTLDLAREFAKGMPDLDDPVLNKLSRDIEAEIHGDCFLAELVKKGIAYHVGYLPSAIRLKIEELYKSESRHIKTLFCTSTLVEGVNLPADNLFITSYFSGNSIMCEVDFMNLVGRVGRIKYNLFGNVILARLEDNKNNVVKQFERFLQSEVPAQKLSVVTELTKPQKQKIIECLSQGSMELLKYPKDQPAENYELMRKFAIILVKDIVRDRKSVVRDEFAPFLTPEIETQIRTAFDSKKERMDDDINISVDQTEDLATAIAGGLDYPPLDFSAEDGKPFITHENLMAFLNRLCDIFKWEKYEFGTLGKLSKACGHKCKCDCPKTERKALGLYAVVLSRWLQGYGVRYIIERSLQYRRDTNSDIQLPDRSFVKFDYNDKEHKNIVIGETLDVIENVILFKISSYFLKFTTEFKRIHGKLPEYDWYEYVEYGTTDSLSIFFQRNGFERETANYIRVNNYFRKDEANGEYRILNSILSCGKESVLRDINDNRPNVPELFVD